MTGIPDDLANEDLGITDPADLMMELYATEDPTLPPHPMEPDEVPSD